MEKRKTNQNIQENTFSKLAGSHGRSRPKPFRGDIRSFSNLIKTRYHNILCVTTHIVKTL